MRQTLKSKNIFVDVLNFAFDNNKQLLYTILCLTTSSMVEYDEVSLISTAKIYMDIASKVNPKVTTCFKKLNGVILQSCGLNETGITILSKLGESTGPVNLLKTRTELAVHDEVMVKNLAKDCYMAIVMDNLDREVKKVVQHHTLPVLLFRDVPDMYHELSDNKKSLDDVMSSFHQDFFCLDSACNLEEKTAFLNVTFTVLAQICNSIPGCDVFSNIFPSNHDHSFKDIMSKKVKRHIENTIDKSEMDTANIFLI